MIKSMKKLLFTTIAILLSLNSFAGTTETPISEIETIEIQQTSSWEYLGDIQAVSEEFSNSFTAKLYVRIIGEREFYQVRYNDKEGLRTSAVTFGNYFCKGKRYNAKFLVHFMVGNYSYYFNL